MAERSPAASDEEDTTPFGGVWLKRALDTLCDVRVRRRAFDGFSPHRGAPEQVTQAPTLIANDPLGEVRARFD